MTTIENHNRRHGQRATYIVDGCRCLPCRAANSAYGTRRVRQRAYGRVAYVDAAPARAHLEFPRAAGMGHRTIAKRAGGGHGSVSALLYGLTPAGIDQALRNGRTAA
jgi:hypothetical protein